MLKHFSRCAHLYVEKSLRNLEWKFEKVSALLKGEKANPTDPKNISCGKNVPPANAVSLFENRHFLTHRPQLFISF